MAHMQDTLEREFPDGLLSVDVDLSFDVTPGEPMVRYYPDGSGYPGSDPSAELTDLRVTRITGERGDIRRAEFPELFALLDSVVRDWRTDDQWQERYFDHASDHYVGPDDRDYDND